MKTPSLLLAYIALSLAQVAISVNVVTNKFLVVALPMLFILAARFSISTVLLSGTLVLTRTPLCDPRHPDKKLSARDWFLAILSGVFAAFLFNALFLLGLQYTTATAAGIIGSTLPALVALSAVWLLKERLNMAKILAILLAMLGILVINLDHFNAVGELSHSYLGDGLIFLAMFPEAWYSIVMRKLAHRITPLGSALIANMVGLAVFLPCALYTLSDFSLETVTATQWALVTLAGLTSLLFFWAWGWGLTLISASTAGIFGGVMPVATTLLAILFLGESPQWYDAVGMLLILGSIIIGTDFTRLRVKKSAPLSDA